MFKQTYLSNLHRSHSSVRTLTAMLFLLAVLPVTSGTIYTDEPPPLPRKEWVGKTKLNYNALHDDYADVLVCLYVPVGVLGLYIWLASVLMALSSIYQAYCDR